MIEWIGFPLRKLFLLTAVFTTLPPLTYAESGKTPAEMLGLNLEELANIRVTVASKKSESQLDAPAIISVIQVEDARSEGMRTLKDVLTLVPNVLFETTSLGTTSIMIRGLSDSFNQKVLFLVDG